MNLIALGVLISVGIFLAILICLEIGFRIGLRDSAKYGIDANEGIGVIEAAVFALLGLLLAFSFSGGTERLQTRRQLIVQEANAIGTAYLRLDLLPKEEQPAIRDLFREYTDARIKVYENVTDTSGTQVASERSSRLQKEIWSRSIEAGTRDASGNATRLLLPALNEMIDVTTSRRVAVFAHVPALIFGLLFSMALLSGLLAGYAMSKRKARSALHYGLYSAVIAITLYTVIDLDYPRVGLINLQVADSAMRETRDAMK